MYGKSAIDLPQRIVCLTPETADILHAIGAGARVVGVHPSTEDVDRIVALEPDLVLATSGVVTHTVRDLVAAGLAVLATSPSSFDDVLRSILLIGAAAGHERQARQLVEDMRDEVKQVREYSSVWPDRPRVYFEEWFDPPTTGVRWVSDLIEIAGGRDLFRDAQGRVVEPGEIIRRDPQIIVASWRGRSVDSRAIATRPGWEAISAVRSGQIHQIGGAHILSPGPSLMAGLRALHEIIQAFQSTSG